MLEFHKRVLALYIAALLGCCNTTHTHTLAFGRDLWHASHNTHTRMAPAAMWVLYTHCHAHTRKLTPHDMHTEQRETHSITRGHE